MTLATSSSAPQSTSIPKPPRSPQSQTRCPRSSHGIPLRLRSVLIEPRPPRFRPQPDQLRSLLGGRPDPRQRRRGDAQAPTFRSADCATLGFSPKLALKVHRLDQAQPATPPLARSSPPSRGDANIASTQSPCPLPTARQRPYQGSLHPGRISPRRPGNLPARLGDRLPPRPKPRCSKSRWKDPSTCAPPATTPRHRRRPERPDRHRPRRPC